MSGFTVEDHALQAAGFQLAQVVDGLDEDMVVLRRRVEDLLAAAWSGRAAGSFQAGWQEWERGYARSRSGLREMARLLERTADVYARAERATAAPFRAAAQAVR